MLWTAKVILLLSGLCVSAAEDETVELVKNSLTEEIPAKAAASDATDVVDTTEKPENDVEGVIQRFEHIIVQAEKANDEGVLPADEVEKLYSDAAGILDELLESTANRENSYKFLKAKGIERVISPNLEVSDQTKGKLLQLLKKLFENTPTTTKHRIPITVVDSLLEIFENEDHLGVKALVLDVLYLWLPNNPRVQARVMRLKGLEPFYDQVSKLSADVVHTLLDLFNKIIKEHVAVRNSSQQKTKADYDKLKFYQQIGLIERLSTPNVCNGLLHIFELLWSSNINDSAPNCVFELIGNVKQHCLEVYQRSSKPWYLFRQMLEFVRDAKHKDMLENMGVNVSEAGQMLEGLVNELQSSVKEDL